MPLKLSNGEMLDEFREQNLRKLAYWHLGPGVCSPMGFDMSWFCLTAEHSSRDPIASPTCGTVGCLVGHGPLCGVNADRSEDWYEYSWRCFIPIDCTEIEWAWCFADDWTPVDNTPEGGAKRILWLLEFGLPNDWERQMVGEVELCYANWTPAVPEPIREEWEARERVMQ